DGIRDFHVTGVQTCALPIFAAPAQESAEAAERRARLAAAALLVEVVRDDEGMDPAERTALLGSLNRKFGLEESEAAELVALAERSEERRVGQERGARRARDG